MCKAEREGSGLLYKIIKDLYQIISKLSEHQEVTDIIWYDILFIDNLGSNTPWKKSGSSSGSKSGSNLNVSTLAYRCKSHINRVYYAIILLRYW